MIDKMSPHIVVKIPSVHRISEMRRWLSNNHLMVGEDYEYYGKTDGEKVAFGFMEHAKKSAFLFKLTFGGS